MNDLEMAQAMKGLFIDGMESPEAAHGVNFALARLFDDWLVERGISSARPFARINRLCVESGMPPLPLWQIISEVAIAHRLAGSFLPITGEDSK